MLLCQMFSRFLKLTDESIFYITDVEDEVILLLESLFESGGESIESYLIALHVLLTFAFYALNIVTKERYLLAVWVDAHPLDFVGIVTEKSLWVDAEMI